MTDGEALLRTILERPADDTARLVYADWLQERGQEQWAQFIRATRANWHYVYFLRNELARSIPTATFSGYGREEGDSPDFDLPRWSFSFPERFAFGRAIWDRGFVSHLVLPLAAFMEHAEALFRAHPIERVTITDREPLRYDYMMGVVAAMWVVDADSPSDMQALLPESLYMNLHAEVQYMVECGFTAGTYECAAKLARDALSQTCVAYGRSLAGLSALVSA